MSSSSSGARLGSGDSPRRTLFFQQLTPPPRSLLPSLARLPSLLSNRRFFFFFFPAKPLSLFLLVASSLSYPRAPPFSLSLFRSFLTSLRSVLSMSVQFFLFFTIALSLPSCSFPWTRSPKSARTTCGWRSNMNRAITIVDDYLIYVIKRSRERELWNSNGLFFRWMKKLRGMWI